MLIIRLVLNGMIKIGIEKSSRVGHRQTLPKPPTFRDKTDDIDSYLFRFETHATALKWDRAHWVTYLSALLEGTALTLFIVCLIQKMTLSPMRN